MTTKHRSVCDTCNKKIPKNPRLICCICDKLVHLSCQKLTKADAFDLLNVQALWSCIECNQKLFPLDPYILTDKRPETTKIAKFKAKCDCCNGYSYKKENVRTCCHCNSNVHIKCWKRELGCIRCCETLIPGYHLQNIHELYDFDHSNRGHFNPFTSSHFTQLIGDEETDVTEDWNEFSEILTRCKYKQPTQIKCPSDSELSIFSLNIQTLANNTRALRGRTF